MFWHISGSVLTLSIPSNWRIHMLQLHHLIEKISSMELKLLIVVNHLWMSLCKKFWSLLLVPALSSFTAWQSKMLRRSQSLSSFCFPLPSLLSFISPSASYSHVLLKFKPACFETIHCYFLVISKVTITLSTMPGYFQSLKLWNENF